MKNKHVFEIKVLCRCPYRDCGKTFEKRIKVQYITNQRGDVIEQKVIN